MTWFRGLLLVAAACCLAGGALAQGRSGSVLPGANGGGPLSINADKLDYFDKDQKLIYAGSVVVKQGGATLKASAITVFMSGETAGGAPGSMNQIRRLEAAGPVTITSQDQVGAGDRGYFERSENKVHLVGRVSLTQGPNVQTCDELIYDLTRNVASCTGKGSGRVSGMFTPGSQPPAIDDKPKPDAAKPRSTNRNPRP